MKSLSSGIRERHKWGEEREKNAKKNDNDSDD